MDDLFEKLYFLVVMDYNYLDHDIEFLDNVFPLISIFMLSISAIGALFFYSVINRVTPNFSGKQWWIVNMLTFGIISFIVALVRVKNILYPFDAIKSDGWLLAVSVFMYSCLFYFLCSILFKRKVFTLYAHNTPW